MKRKLSILLILAMLISLVSLSACGGEPATDDPAGNPPSSSAPDNNTPADPGTAGPKYDNIVLTTATSYNEAGFSGSLIKWFGDYLAEKSDGAVTVQCYYGGSFCADAEVYDYVMAGDMNLSFVQPVYCMTYMPFAFGIASGVSNEHCMAVGNGVLYDNPETAALIQEQAAQYNLHVLAHTSAGSSIFLSKNEVVSYEDASQYTIGSPINLEIYAQYGFAGVAIEPADMYDSLSRGVCDLVAYSAANALTDNLYEVAPHVGDMRAYFTNQVIMMNNDVWNSLNQATQDLIIEAALAVADYSVVRVQELEAELYELCETYHKYTDEEGMDFNYRSMVSTSNLVRGFAENLGCQEKMEIIIQAWADGLGHESF